MHANKNCYSGRLKEGKKTNVRRKKERKKKKERNVFNLLGGRKVQNTLKRGPKVWQKPLQRADYGRGGSRPARLR